MSTGYGSGGLMDADRTFTTGGGLETTFSLPAINSSSTGKSSGGEEIDECSFERRREVSAARLLRLTALRVTADDTRLPNGVNFVALRETFLAEAPFVRRATRGFWKKWIDCLQFQAVLSISLRLVLNSISEHGVVDAKQLFETMAHPCLFENYDPATAASQRRQMATRNHSRQSTTNIPLDRTFDKTLDTNHSFRLSTGDNDSRRDNSLSKSFSNLRLRTASSTLPESTHSHSYMSTTTSLFDKDNRINTIPVQRTYPHRESLEKIAVCVADMLMMDRDLGFGDSKSNSLGGNQKRNTRIGTSDGVEGPTRGDGEKKVQQIRGKGGESKQHDVFFYRLPELLGYMLLQALLGTLPRLSRVFYSVRFRELLLDYLSEMVRGVRMTNPRMDREWLFAEATDHAIMIVNPPNSLSSKSSLFSTNLSSTNATNNSSHTRLQEVSATGVISSTVLGDSLPHRQTITRSSIATLTKDFGISRDGVEHSTDPLTSATAANSVNDHFAASANSQISEDNHVRSLTSQMAAFERQKSGQATAHSFFTLGNSPLIRIFMNLGRTTFTPEDLLPGESPDLPFMCAHATNVSMAHLPGRPLVHMQPMVVRKPGKHRKRRIDSFRLDELLKTSTTKRAEIMTAAENGRRDMEADVRNMRRAYKLQIDALRGNGSVVSQKQLLAAAAAIGRLTKSESNLPSSGATNSAD